MDEIREVVLDTEEMKEFFFQELIHRGYVPDEMELDEIADICFDYLIEKVSLMRKMILMKND